MKAGNIRVVIVPVRPVFPIEGQIECSVLDEHNRSLDTLYCRLAERASLDTGTRRRLLRRRRWGGCRGTRTRVGRLARLSVSPMRSPTVCFITLECFSRAPPGVVLICPNLRLRVHHHVEAIDRACEGGRALLE